MKGLRGILLALGLAFGLSAPVLGKHVLGVHKQRVTTSVAHTNNLRFPSNVSGADQAAPYAVLKFEDPQSNGLPIWGPGNAGVTYIWEYTPIQQTGYYVGFWWSNDGTPSWDAGSTNTYYGCHPYPQNGNNSGTTHYWELAGMDYGGDNTVTLGGSPLTVVKGVTYTQGFRVTHNGSTKTGRYYINLPSTANSNIIEAVAAAGFGNTNPPDPAITWGDSPWYASYQHERMSGDLGRIKIIAKVLSEADMLAEAADMSRMVTVDGIANIWWGKNNWDSVNDLTCDFGTGRSFTRVDASNLITLVPVP